jgi:hypothetical protein
MRIAAIVALAVALPALAQSPTSFVSSAPLALSGKEALHRVALPPEAYRDARGDLADVRIFNSSGEAVPIAFASDPEGQHDALAAVDLPQFAISALARSTGGPGSEISVRTQDGTLVSIRGQAAAPIAKPSAYLLDASQVKEPLRALVFDWVAAPGAQVVKVRVEASDNLKDWSALASGPLVRVENAGAALSQPRLEFGARTAKYLRITWDVAEFSLKGVRAEREGPTQPAPRTVSSVVATPGEHPGEWLYDAGGRLPVEALRVRPADANDVLSANVLARNDPKEPWRSVTSAPFYRMQYEGADRESPALEIPRTAARYWMVRLAGARSATPPVLEVQWRAVQVVFVARGEPPFMLAFGNPAARAVALPVSTLVPGYERLAEWRLPEARVGAVENGPGPSSWEQLTASTSPRHVVLWLILLGGVAMLGFMAWRLSRQVR